MYSFLIAIVLLILGYLFYGKLVNRIFSPDDRDTPAIRINDGVDYVPMPRWKAILIQLLNIAGTGPIFGALSGALFGPIVFLWIIFGCILGGAVHDFYTGMISCRMDGASIAEITGHYLGNGMKQVMRVFSVILLIMCGVVFTTGPANLLAMLTPDFFSPEIWLWVIIAYYFIATFLPIDKIIGRIYPLFGVCLILMAVGVTIAMIFSGDYEMPEVWNNFTNMHPEGLPVWPFMFITVACGAISGFHATQSPMMARCIKSEKQGRSVFYGAMILEGIIALVWAAAGVSFYENSQALLDAGGGCSAVVYDICTSSMGKVGAGLAILGVIACPITSGDTAYRSARLTLSDWFKLDQKSIKNRLILTLPLLAVGALICHVDYAKVWRYFSFSNQTLAMIVLWTISVYLFQNKKNYFISLVPAVFMSGVTMTYLFCADECLGAVFKLCGLEFNTYYIISLVIALALSLLFLFIFIRYVVKNKNTEFERL